MSLYINSAGLIEDVPHGQEQRAAALGWVLASPEQVRDFELKQKYGTTGQAALAGLESAGSVLTFGLSTAAETALGVDPEAIRAREEANPIASGIGTAVGIGVPLVLTAGASAPASAGAAAAKGAASVSAPALLAKAGQATSKAVRAALPEASTMLGRMAVKAGAAAAGGAIEGAGYELGNLVHEAALGDPNLTAESALARIGTGALLMGGLSGAGGAMGSLLKDAGGHLANADLSPKLSEWLKEVEVRSNLKASGAIQSNLKRAAKQSGEDNLEKIAMEMRDLGILTGPLNKLDTVAERASAVQARSGELMGELLRSADEIGMAEGAKLGRAQAMLATARRDLLKPLADNPLTIGAAKNFDDALTAWGEKFADGATLGELHQLRKDLSEFVYGLRGQMDPLANAQKKTFRDFRRMVSREIEDGLERSGMPKDIWKTANREYEVASKALDFANAGMERSAGNNLVSLTEGLGAMTGVLGGGPVGGALAGLGVAAARRQGSSVLGWAARGVREALEGRAGNAVTAKTGEMIAAERLAAAQPGVFSQAPLPLPAGIAATASASPETAAAMALLKQAAENTDKEITKSLREAMEGIAKALPRAALAERNIGERMAAVQRATADSGLLDRLAQDTSDVHEHAPNTATAIQAARVRGLSFLADKVPGRQTDAMGKPLPVSKEQELRFGRYWSAVEDPLSVVRRAATGQVTNEELEALRTVYPALHQRIQQLTIEAMADAAARGKPPKFHARMRLSRLTGLPLDQSLQPKNILRTQALYAMPSQKDGQDVAKPRAAGFDKLKVANRAMTPSQRMEARLEGAN